MLGEHLPCIVDLDGAKCFSRQSADDEVTHREKELLVSLDLSVVLAPLIQDTFQPETLTH